MKALEGKIALITGVGRREGIGYALCEACAVAGAHIFYTYWHPYDVEMKLEGSDENPSVFGEDFKQYGVEVVSCELDLSKTDSAEVLFREVVAKIGVPNILINNACVSTNQPFAEMSGKLLDKHYEVNVRATTLLCKEFFMKSNDDGGTIVNLTSGQSLGIMEGELPYTITKASVDMLTLQLAPVLRQKNIAIYAVDPGPTDTGWITPELREILKKESEKGKITTPKEVASFVISCITGEHGTTTGTIVHVPR